MGIRRNHKIITAYFAVITGVIRRRNQQFPLGTAVKERLLV